MPVDHRLGQHRAELFDELLYYLLRAMFEGATVRRHFRISPQPFLPHPPALRVLDFVIEIPNSGAVIVEARAPYTEHPAFGINKTLRSFKKNIPRLRKILAFQKVVFAIASELPVECRRERDRTADYFRNVGIDLEVWDVPHLRSLLQTHLNVTLLSFGLEELRSVLGEQRARQASAARPQGLSAGKSDNTVALFADLCSYSKFVHASGEDWDLILSIMGRFYRQCRFTVEAQGGLIHQFIGDGLLAFWLPSKRDDFASKFLRCLSELIGHALAVAKEWQEEIDFAVAPIGMTMGAAIGKVLFIPEVSTSNSPIHAAGDCINVAARLQGHARPNTLLISNKLRSAYFSSDGDFVAVSPKQLRNIGEVVVWERDFEKRT